MRIRKKYQVIPTNAKLENGHSTSDKNGYTCEYVNQILANKLDFEINANNNYIPSDSKYLDATGIKYNNTLLSDILQNNIYHIVAPSTGSSGSTSVTFNLGRYNMRCFLVTFTKGTNDQSGNSALWYMSANGLIAPLSNPQNYTLSVSINRNTGDITLTGSGMTYATMTVIIL